MRVARVGSKDRTCATRGPSAQSHPPAALVADECPIDVGGSQRVRDNTRVVVVDTGGIRDS